MDGARLKGDIGEAQFLVEALKLNFSILKPWSDKRYDFVLEKDGKFIRIQIKSCHTIQKMPKCTRYSCNLQGGYYGDRLISCKEIDYLVAYIVPENIWYIIPSKYIEGMKCLHFYPNSKNPSTSFTEQFRNNWSFKYGIYDCKSGEINTSMPNIPL